MLKHFLVINVLLSLGLMGCGSPNTPASPVATARPSPTLELAPTRGTNPTRATNATRAPFGSPAPSGSVGGRFAFAPGDGSIWLQELPAAAHPLVTPTADIFADAPAFSPDGNRIVYTQSALTARGLPENSLQLIEVNGKNQKLLLKAPDNKTSYNWPVFAPDGKSVYVTTSFPAPPNRLHSEIQRVSIDGGAPQRVVDEARSGVLSGDGKRIAFLRFNFDTFASGLWIADANGQNAKPLLGDDAFAAIAAPRFSPDSQSVLFVASGPPNRKLPGALLQPKECEPQLLCAFAEPAYANGLPWDLWLVTADGARFTQLTQIGADSPWPAWSRDGKSIAFFDTSGIYLFDVNKRTLTQLNKDGGHGVFDWWSPP